ncbi:hypothetical protein QR685DRAFT_567221 [Neurospora intermedia]|uniref:Uncharacterized protein n=1 Tax=Neurospora intermedia TaxID=5142 RepID=A0ABR3DNK4_NEUIN
MEMHLALERHPQVLRAEFLTIPTSLFRLRASKCRCSPLCRFLSSPNTRAKPSKNSKSLRYKPPQPVTGNPKPSRTKLIRQT